MAKPTKHSEPNPIKRMMFASSTYVILAITALFLFLTGLFLGWSFNLQCIFSLSAISLILIPHVIEKRAADNRKAAVEQYLSSRKGIDFDREVQELSKDANLPDEEIKRIWCGLANYYGVRFDKLRSTDRLIDELRGLVMHHYFDVTTCKLVERASQQKRTEIPKIQTWGQLVCFLYSVEQEAGQRGTIAKKDQSSESVIWGGNEDAEKLSRCKACGYNLISHSFSRCPECGGIDHFSSAGD